LTFIVGIYGMNFDYMPELRWKWGYGWSYVLMAVTTLAMIAYFKWRGWMTDSAVESGRG
jgi:magnesium transporter